METVQSIPQTRIRGGGNDEEDLYFVPSDNDEGNEEDERNSNTSTDKKNESTIEEVNTRKNNENDEEMTGTNTEEGTKTTRKKMKVKQDNFPFGHVCDDIAVDDDTQYVRVYCQNVSEIFDREGIGLDSAFKEIKQAGADIFTFNETHGDESNATARRALRLSKQRMWKDDNEDCKIVHSSSTAPVLTFTKLGGNLVGITGPLVGRVRDTITDPYGRWCGYTLIGSDTK
jgi:hypothetical protein